MIRTSHLVSAVTAAFTVALVSASAFATPEGWTTDFPAAKAEAAASDKDLLMDFTGSDWCGWCIKLKDEVFLTDEFKAVAPSDFVMVELDFPNAVPQTDAVKAQNAALASKYNIQGYPTIILADAKGKPYAQTGYQPGGPEAYLAHLDELQAIRVTRDEAMAKAKDADGIEKAKALDEAMQAVGIQFAIGHYPSVVESIIALDADNSAGLKSKYDTAMSEMKMDADMQDAIQLLQSGDAEAGLAKLDQVIETHEPQGESLQMITAIKGQVHLQMGEMDQGMSLLEQAVAVAPESPIAGQINAMIQQVKSQPPAQ